MFQQKQVKQVVDPMKHLDERRQLLIDWQESMLNRSMFQPNWFILLLCINTFFIWGILKWPFTHSMNIMKH